MIFRLMELALIGGFGNWLLPVMVGTSAALLLQAVAREVGEAYGTLATEVDQRSRSTLRCTPLRSEISLV